VFTSRHPQGVISTDLEWLSQVAVTAILPIQIGDQKEENIGKIEEAHRVVLSAHSHAVIIFKTDGNLSSSLAALMVNV